MSENGVMISVAIPSYNSEKYIIKLLDSIKNQTYKDFEIVISNDCSTDNSLNLIEEYKKNFSELKINIINQKKNVGLVENRNLILKECKGKYITFVDADDYIEPECLEKLINEAIRVDADMVIGAFRTVDDNDKILQDQYLPEKPSKYMCGVHHARLYRRKIFEENEIKFDCGCIEDVYVTSIFACYTKNVGFVNEILYNWVIHEKSSTASKKYISEFNGADNLKCCLEKLKRVYCNIENNEEKLIFDYYILKVYYCMLYHNYRYANIKEKIKTYKYMRKLMTEFNADYKKNPLIKFRYPTPARKYAKIIVWISVMLERTHLMPCALIGYHFVSKIHYFDV